MVKNTNIVTAAISTLLNYKNHLLLGLTQYGSYYCYNVLVIEENVLTCFSASECNYITAKTVAIRFEFGTKLITCVDNYIL